MKALAYHPPIRARKSGNGRVTGVLIPVQQLVEPVLGGV
jgi:hypothetical protein